MSESVNQASDLLELQQLEFVIREELDLGCEILPVSAEMPVETLLVMLEQDAHERTRIASLMFVPLHGTQIETLKIIQLYIETPVLVDTAGGRQVMSEFFSVVNQKIPLGAFAFNDEGLVTFKYVHALGKDSSIVQEHFLELFLLWMFTLDSVSPLIDALAEGRMDLAGAVEVLNA
jgi:hypothetical protein